MIPAKELVAIFQMMLADKWGYIPATAGIKWTESRQRATGNAMAQKYGSKWIGHMVADCSGAFVYAYKKFNESIYHGSNNIARYYVEELLPPEKAKPGMAAFKYYAPGQKGYTLPAGYHKGDKWYNGDLNDYYHIGLVDEDPNYILNSATTQNGFIRSKRSNGWNAVGYLKAVKYEDLPEIKDEVTPVYSNYYVTDDKVNMRAKPNTSASRVIYLNGGDVVSKISESGDWFYVRFNGKYGYVMQKFLAPVVDEAFDVPADEPAAPEGPAADANDIRRQLKKIEEAAEKAQEGLEFVLAQLNELLNTL